jgi:hypothetical protein
MPALEVKPFGQLQPRAVSGSDSRDCPRGNPARAEPKGRSQSSQAKSRKRGILELQPSDCPGVPM